MEFLIFFSNHFEGGVLKVIRVLQNLNNIFLFMQVFSSKDQRLYSIAIFFKVNFKN